MKFKNRARVIGKSRRGKQHKTQYKITIFQPNNLFFSLCAHSYRLNQQQQQQK